MTGVGAGVPGQQSCTSQAQIPALTGSFRYLHRSRYDVLTRCLVLQNGGLCHVQSSLPIAVPSTT